MTNDNQLTLVIKEDLIHLLEIAKVSYLWFTFALILSAFDYENCDQKESDSFEYI